MDGQNSGWLGHYQGQPNSRANISEGERLPSLVVGGCLVAHGLIRRTPAALLLGVLGAAMVYRGVTSRCVGYAALGVNRAPADHNPNATVRHNEGIKVDKSLTIRRSAEDLYAYWRDFEHLPRFMDHILSVVNTGERRSHWVVKAPMARTVEWDAEIINEVPNRLIAWRTTDNAEIANAGSVRFQPSDDGRGTLVRVELEYDAPGGHIGALVAKLFQEEPAQQISDGLRRFKNLMEADMATKATG